VSETTESGDRTAGIVSLAPIREAALRTQDMTALRLTGEVHTHAIAAEARQLTIDATKRLSRCAPSKRADA